MNYTIINVEFPMPLVGKGLLDGSQSSAPSRPKVSQRFNLHRGIRSKKIIRGKPKGLQRFLRFEDFAEL